MTNKNPLKGDTDNMTLTPRSSLSMTFNINQIKQDMLKQSGGKLSAKMEHQIMVLEKMDESGDGEISLMELIHMEESKEVAEKEGKRMKKIICAIILFIIFCLGCMLAMGVAAVEMTKETRVRGGTPVAATGKSAGIAAKADPKADSRRRLGDNKKRKLDGHTEAWDHDATYKPAPSQTPVSAEDLSEQDKYKANEGKTAKKIAEEAKAERLDHCDKCRDIIDKEILDGNAAALVPGTVQSFPSLTNEDCEKCPICLFNNMGRLDFTPTQNCPKMPDTADGTKDSFDPTGIMYGLGSAENPITVTQEGVEFIAKTIIDADATKTITKPQANFQALVQVLGTVPTIPDGVPRSFVVDASASGKDFDGITKITVKLPGTSDDVVLEGKMEVAPTHAGFADEAQFVVKATSAAMPEKKITLHDDGSISLNKAAQEDFYNAGQLSPHQNMDPDRAETTVTLPATKMAVVVAEGTTSAVNMNAEQVAANMPPFDVENMDPVAGNLTYPDRPAHIEPVPATISQEMEYTDYEQCDHTGCTINDEGVEQYVTGEHVDAAGVVHPIYSLFKATHVSVTQDATHMKIETMGEMHTDDVSGVHMASGETINIKNNPDGVKDQMLKEEHSYCHGAMCQTFVEETGASDTIVNMDGSLTCKEEECVTNYEAVEKDSIDRNQALSPCLPQVMGGATEMHEEFVEAETRRLKQLYRKSSKIHPKNVKHTPHHLLAAHAFRQLAATVSAEDLTMFETPECVVVEYCHDNVDYGSTFAEEDQAVIANALGDMPEDHNNRRLRSLHARRRRLTAIRHVTDRKAKHHRTQRLVRKVHLRARKLAKAHLKNRRRLNEKMATGAGYEHDLDDVAAETVPYHFNSFTETALESANALSETLDDPNYDNALRNDLYDPEYYGSEPLMTPGGDYAVDPVNIAESHKDATFGAGTPSEVKCNELETYKIMESDKQAYESAVELESAAESATRAAMTILAGNTMTTAQKAEYYNDVVEPLMDALTEATYELDQHNATLHNSAQSFIADFNLHTAEQYIVDHMYTYVETETAALEVAYNAKTACVQDPTVACTPDSFDFDHYLDTGETHPHEVDNPIQTYDDFEECALAYLATQHVDELIDTLIEIDANLEAAANKPSSCGFVSFEKSPAADGGIKMTRQHSTRTIPSTEEPYRRLKQHDYGRRRRRLGATDAGSFNREGSAGAAASDTVIARTEARVTQEVERVQEERGTTSSVDMVFIESDAKMDQSPSEREENTITITAPENEVQDSKDDIGKESAATAKSQSTERTAYTVLEEITRDLGHCKKTEEDANDKCDGCGKNIFEASYGHGRCIDICNKFQECKELIVTTATKMLQASRETSTSLTTVARERASGADADQPGCTHVQIQLNRNSTRSTGANSKEDEEALDHALDAVRQEMHSTPDPHSEKDNLEADTRGHLEREREASRGSDATPDSRLASSHTDSPLSAHQRYSSNTTFDTPTAARPITNPGKDEGVQSEPMPDTLPAEVMCNATVRDKRNCTCTVTYPADPKTNPIATTFEHNVNGPPGMEGNMTSPPSGPPTDEERQMEMEATMAADRGESVDDMNNYTCSHKVQDRMCFDLHKDANGQLSAPFGDVESGEFRIFFDLFDDKKTQICLSIDGCGHVILDPARLTGQATFPTRIATRLANDCLDSTGDAMMCCPGTGTMTRDTARANGKDEFFVCDMSNMSPDTLKSEIFDVDVTIRYDTNSDAPVIEMSDMGHMPMHISSGISIDYHFMQEYFPTYATAGKFCAGFDVHSSNPGFDPNCPECSMCDDDGTDRECMQHAGNLNGCLNEPHCLFNNLTKECHSLPGDDNLPHTMSTGPMPCDSNQAYCAHPRSGEPTCVGVREDKCFNCMDVSVFNDEVRGRRCGTPSGPTCASQGMFYCQASHQCVGYCGYDCHLKGTNTGVYNIEPTAMPMLVGDPQSHVCIIPDPNACHRIGKTFCEATQNCVHNCWDCHQPGSEYVEVAEVRADAGVKFHSNNNYGGFQGNATVCRAVDATVCGNQQKNLCKNSHGARCIEKCEWCDEKPADDGNICVRPSQLTTKYWCPPNHTTVANCNMCKHEGDWDAPYTVENTTTRLCQQDPDYQKPGFYRCSIHSHDGKVDVEYDVRECATECIGYNPDTNNFYAKKVHNDDANLNTCEPATPEACRSFGMVWCPHDQTELEDGSSTGDCVLACENCYKPYEYPTDGYTAAPEWTHEPLSVNVSNTCTSLREMQNDCRDEGKYWCEESLSCSSDCSDCQGEVDEWSYDESSNWVHAKKMEDFKIKNDQEGVCSVPCPYITRNAEQVQTVYCPLTKSCLPPSDNTYGDTACDACGTYSFQDYDNLWNPVCKEITKDVCNSQLYRRWCPTTHKCLDWSEQCSDSCPGLTFDPPHWPGHEKYNAGSCMQKKSNVTEKCTNSDFLDEWATPQVYCHSQWGSYCTNSCDDCKMWDEDTGEETHTSENDGTGYCSFQAVVTTHNEPMNDYIPSYNHTVIIEDDGTETETWVEEPQNHSTTEYTSYHEVANPWCNERMSHVIHCDECGSTMDGNLIWTPSQMVLDATGTICEWPEYMYGCNDPTATNYDPHANKLYDEYEKCPPKSESDYCYTCDYSSYNNTMGYTMPEGTLDMHGMPMNFTEPDAAMFNNSYNMQ
jgi:hypothetical protein